MITTAMSMSPQRIERALRNAMARAEQAESAARDAREDLARERRRADDWRAQSDRERIERLMYQERSRELQRQLATSRAEIARLTSELAATTAELALHRALGGTSSAAVSRTADVRVAPTSTTETVSVGQTGNEDATAQRFSQLEPYDDPA